MYFKPVDDEFMALRQCPAWDLFREGSPGAIICRFPTFKPQTLLFPEKERVACTCLHIHYSQRDLTALDKANG